MTERLNVSPSIFGTPAWTFLDLAAASASDVLVEDEAEGFSNLIKSLKHVTPCEQCRMHTEEYEERTPVLFNSREDVQRWLLGLRNDINERLGKKSWSYGNYLEHVEKLLGPEQKLDSNKNLVFAGVFAFIAILIFIYAISQKSYTSK
jgi:hypothetical protein